MSDLTDAATNLSNAATRANKTTDFFDDVTTLGPTSTVKNPNNNKTVPSVQKQVKDLFDSLPADESVDALEAAAISVGAKYEEVIATTNTATVLDDVLYLFDLDEQITYAKPSDVGIGEVIVSVDSGVLTTDAGTYTLKSINKSGVIFETIADIDSGNSIGGKVNLIIGDTVIANDYATGNNSGVLFFKVVAGGTGTADGGKYIDLSSGMQLEQNLKTPYSDKAWGVIGGAVDETLKLQSLFDYTTSNNASCSLFSRVYSVSKITVTGSDFSIDFGRSVFNAISTNKDKVLEVLNSNSFRLSGTLIVNGTREIFPSDEPPEGAFEAGDIDIRGSYNFELGTLESNNGYNNGIVIDDCHDGTFEKLKSEYARNFGVNFWGTGGFDSQTTYNIHGRVLEGNYSQGYHGVRISGARNITADLLSGVGNVNNGVLHETGSQDCIHGRIYSAGNGINGGKFQESKNCHAAVVIAKNNVTAGFGFIDSQGCSVGECKTSGNAYGAFQNGVGVTDARNNSINTLISIDDDIGLQSTVSGGGVSETLSIGIANISGANSGVVSANVGAGVVPFSFCGGVLKDNVNDFEWSGSNKPPILGDVVYSTANFDLAQTLEADSTSPTVDLIYDSYTTANTVSTAITSLIPSKSNFRGVIYIRINDANTSFAIGTGDNRIANSLSVSGGSVVLCKKFASFWLVSLA